MNEAVLLNLRFGFKLARPCQLRVIDAFEGVSVPHEMGYVSRERADICHAVFVTAVGQSLRADREERLFTVIENDGATSCMRSRRIHRLFTRTTRAHALLKTLAS
jgi:hypothetical protein